MRTIIVTLAIGLLTQQIIPAQGTLYVSNLGQTPTGSYAVGNDSWYATSFNTGNNTDGYLLDSIDLEMANATGNPSDFSVMLYANGNPAAIIPGSSSIGALSGSLNPATGGVYTYTPITDIILSTYKIYYIVLTSGTTVANGAYNWSLAGANSYNPSGDWSGSGGGVFTSSNGSSWIPIPAAYPQFAITATAIPEPSLVFLILLGSGALMYVRKRRSI